MSLLFRQETDPRPKNVLRKHGSVKKTKSQNFHGEIYSIVLIAFLFHFFSWFSGFSFLLEGILDCFLNMNLTVTQLTHIDCPFAIASLRVSRNIKVEEEEEVSPQPC